MEGNPTILFEAPRKVVLEDLEKPTPGPGELLIQTRCTLISIGTELTILSGEFPRDSAWSRYAQFPFLPGYDNVGDVVAVGPGVDAGWIGRRVATYGSHTRYVAITADAARVLSHQAVPDEEAVFFTIAEIVMNGIRRGQVQPGEAVVVYGLGLLGQLTTRLCRLWGARPVFAVDVEESRLQWLPDDVAIVPLNPAKEEIIGPIEEATRGRTADVAFEVTGNPNLIPEELKTLRQQGRFVVLSSPHGQTQFDFHDFCNWPSFTMIGAHNTSHPTHATYENPWTNHRHAELFFDLVADGDLDVAPLISHREHYTRAPELYAALLEDRSQAMGIVLDWTT